MVGRVPLDLTDSICTSCRRVPVARYVGNGRGPRTSTSLLYREGVARADGLMPVGPGIPALAYCKRTGLVMELKTHGSVIRADQTFRILLVPCPKDNTTTRTTTRRPSPTICWTGKADRPRLSTPIITARTPFATFAILKDYTIQVEAPLPPLCEEMRLPAGEVSRPLALIVPSRAS